MRWRWLKTESDRLPLRNPYRALINIGEDCVRALLVELEPDAVGIIGSAREKRTGPYTLNSVECVADLCERALSKAEISTESTLGHRVVADHALVGVPDTWSLMASGSIKYRRQEPERKMDVSEFRTVLGRAVTFVLSQQAKDTSPSEMEVIYAAVTEVRMDGQRTSDPRGFRGEEMSLGIFLSLLRRERSQYLRDIGYRLGLDPVRLVPLLHALAICLPVPEGIGILLDDSHTDVFRLLDRRVVTSRRISEGIRHMMMGLTDALGIPLGDAQRLRRAHRRGLLDSDVAARVEQELLRQMWLWSLNVRPAVKSVAQDVIPPRIYLCGTGDGLESMQVILSSPEWRKGLRFARHPKVSCFGPGDVTPVLDRTGNLREMSDLGMRCLAVYARSEAQPASHPDALLNEVLRARGYIHSI